MILSAVCANLTGSGYFVRIRLQFLKPFYRIVFFSVSRIRIKLTLKNNITWSSLLTQLYDIYTLYPRRAPSLYSNFLYKWSRLLGHIVWIIFVEVFDITLSSTDPSVIHRHRSHLPVSMTNFLSYSFYMIFFTLYLSAKIWSILLY